MADVATKFGLSSGGGQFYGAQGYKKGTGRYFIPPGYATLDTGTTVTTTATRRYRVPFVVEHNTTFAGAFCKNSGVGDNGDKVKIAVYSEATSGGAGSLAKNFGEVTLTAAAADRLFASSWSASPGRYFIDLVTDNAVALYAMTVTVQVSNVGYLKHDPSIQSMGTVGMPTLSATYATGFPICDYSDTTYANFPESTAIAATTTLYGANIPLFGLYT